MYSTRKKNRKDAALRPERYMFLVIFSTYIFITITIFFSRFKKRIINTFLNRIWNFFSNDDTNQPKMDLAARRRRAFETRTTRPRIY